MNIKENDEITVRIITTIDEFYKILEEKVINLIRSNSWKKNTK